MKAMVAVKEVTVLDDAFEVEDGRIPDAYRSYELNEWDEYALEEAVSLEEAGEIDEVVTVTIGPERVEETIRKALAKGADRAIRVWDDTLDEQEYLSPRPTARILAEVVESESPELVLTGVQAGDTMAGATGVALASAINYGWAAVVNDLDLRDETVAVRRELEGGSEEVTSVDLPAVCTIQTGINEPRYASLRGIRMAQRSEIDTRSFDDLGLDADALDSTISLRGVEKPVVEERAEIFEGSPDETAGRLAEYLAETGVLG